MYSQLNPAILKLTTSANYDNLSVGFHKDHPAMLAIHDNRKVSITWIDQDGNVIDTAMIDPIECAKQISTIIMVRLLKLHERIFIVTVSSKQIKVYTTENYEIKPMFDYFFDPESKIPNMITSIELISKDVFCFSTQRKIYLFQINQNGTSFNPKEFNQDLKSSHTSFIHKFVSCGRSQFALMETSGKIAVWKLNEKAFTFSQANSFEIHPNTKVTCVQVFRNSLILATVSGQIQIIDFKNGKLFCEIQAHTKCITSLDVDHETGFLCSGSEDSFARLFKIDSTNDGVNQVQYLQQFMAPNEMIFGTKFIKPNAKLFAISTFESNQIKLFKLNT